MENDNYAIRLNETDNKDSSLINVFKPDYRNQNFENSIEFQNWKKTMINKYEEEGKFYNCSYDNIIFYSIETNYKEDDKATCPKCNRPICYFCKKEFGRRYYICCLRQIFNHMHKDGIRLLNSEVDKLDDYDGKAFKYFLIPCINFLFFIFLVNSIFFYRLSVKNQEKYCHTCIDNFGDDPLLLGINITLNIFTAVLLLIPFLFYNLFITFIVLILSLFEKSPYTYFLGFINTQWYYLYDRLPQCCL